MDELDFYKDELFRDLMDAAANHVERRLKEIQDTGYAYREVVTKSMYDFFSTFYETYTEEYEDISLMHVMQYFTESKYWTIYCNEEGYPKPWDDVIVNAARNGYRLKEED